MRSTLLIPLVGLLGCESATDALEDEVEAIEFRFPILEPERIFPHSMGYDHDPVDYGDGLDSIHCTAYDGRGFPACYDGHDGTDYELIGGFFSMDEESATIVAGYPGEVIFVADGHYDRCHLNLETWEPDCDGHPVKANRVHLLHDTGHISFYLHMRKDSVLVEVGQWVEAGEPLGLVGSSGRSTAPHLHFELEHPDGKTFDPYAGEYSQPESYWCSQKGPDELPGLCEEL